MKILNVTGYKPMELNIFNENDDRIQFIKYALKKRIVGFIEDGLKWVLISGQMGVEMWTAEVVLELKETYDVKLCVFPPFENLASRWPEQLQHKFEELTFTADFFQSIYKGDYKGPFQFKAKDQWLIEKSDGSLLLMDEEYPGSTLYYHSSVKKAMDHPIYYITPFDLDEIIEEMRMLETDDESYEE